MKLIASTKIIASFAFAMIMCFEVYAQNIMPRYTEKLNQLAQHLTSIDAERIAKQFKKIKDLDDKEIFVDGLNADEFKETFEFISEDNYLKRFNLMEKFLVELEKKLGGKGGFARIPENIKYLFPEFVEKSFYANEDILAEDKILIGRFLNKEISLPTFYKLINSKERLSVINSSKVYEELIENLDDVSKGRSPRFTKLAKQREISKNDVVAQVLNYASGVPEDATGDAFFYPANTENGQCIYKIFFNQNSIAGGYMSGLRQASKFMSENGIQGGSATASIMEDGVDLNKGDLKNINFYKLQGPQQNKFTGTTAYLRYQSRVEGLPDLFECDSNSCNIDRLKRGWALVASKCKGTKKAF